MLHLCIQNDFPQQVRSPGSTRKKSDMDGIRDVTKLIKGCDSKLVEAIVNEVVPKGATGVRFNDISGQEKAKAALQEMVVLPLKRPDIFKDLRGPPKGLLLFGPPGTGKTLIGEISLVCICR